MINLEDFDLKKIYVNNVFDHYGLVPNSGSDIDATKKPSKSWGHEKLDEKLDALQVEFLHGVPVELPEETKREIRKMLIEAKIEENEYLFNRFKKVGITEWNISIRNAELEAELKKEAQNERD